MERPRQWVEVSAFGWAPARWLVEAAARELPPAEIAQGRSSAREAEAAGLLAGPPVVAVAAEAAEAAVAAEAAAEAAAVVAAVAAAEAAAVVASAQRQLKEGCTPPLLLAWPKERAPG